MLRRANNPAHRAGAHRQRPLPQQTGAGGRCRGQHEVFSGNRPALEHQHRRQRIDIPAGGQQIVNCRRHRHQPGLIQIDKPLPGAAPAQGQHPLARGQPTAVWRGDHLAKAFIAGDGRQSGAVAIGAGHGDQIRRIHRGKAHPDPHPSARQRRQRQAFQGQHGGRRPVAVINNGVVEHRLAPDSERRDHSRSRFQWLAPAPARVSPGRRWPPPAAAR